MAIFNRGCKQPQCWCRALEPTGRIKQPWFINGFPVLHIIFYLKKMVLKINPTLFLGLGGENKMVEETLAILVRKTDRSAGKTR